MDRSSLAFLYKAAKEHLEIDLPASEEDIKRKFRILSKIKHPDHGGDAREFQLLKETYDVISSMQGVVEIFGTNNSVRVPTRTSDGYSIFDLGRGLSVEKNGVTCGRCNGKGYIEKMEEVNNIFLRQSHLYRCFECRGTGEVEVWNPALPKMRLW